MTRFPLAFAAILPLALADAALSPLAAQDAGAENLSSIVQTAQSEGEQRLSKLLEGRVAGEPVNCIRTNRSDQMQTIDRTAYVYGRGDTIYVQRTRDPDRIDDSDALVINRYSATQLCRLDQTTTIDPFTGIFSGVVFFEDFVPYTRTKGAPSGEG